LEENGVGKPTSRGVDGGGVQGELFGLDQKQQLLLALQSESTPQEETGASSGPEKENGIGQADAGGSEADRQEAGIGSRRNYSSAQRVYWDQLEQGAYNAYAGGLLFAPLLARYDFLPTLRRVITLATHEGYSVEELALTLFYLDLFGFRSLEDFKRAYREEFGVLMVCAQSQEIGERGSLDR
jgi:hypothetical protein